MRRGEIRWYTFAPPDKRRPVLVRVRAEHLDLTVFAGRYRNEETGRLAYDPKVLLKTPLA
jgi:hypothetical protein